MKRGIEIGVATALVAVAVTTASCSSESSPNQAQLQKLERPLPMPHGVLDLSNPNIRQDLAILPGPIVTEEAGAVQIKDTDPTDPMFNSNGSAFTITVNGLSYAITANHVVNANSKGGSADTPVPCPETQIYSTVNGGESGIPVANHTTRPETFVTEAWGKYSQFAISDSLDFGAYRLQNGIAESDLPSLPIQQTDGALQPGTILYNTNWQSSASKVAPDIATGAKPDVLAGIVLGEIPRNGDKDSGYYAVLTDVQGYAQGQPAKDAPGASGSPWESADGTVRAVMSATNNYKVPNSAVQNVFGINVEGQTGLTVSYIQEVSQQDITGMVGSMNQHDACQ